MTPGDDEQTQILREIWNQLKVLDRNLGGRVDAVKQEVAGVRQEVTALRRDVDGLTVEVHGLRGDVDSLKGEVVGLRSDVDALKREVIETNVRIDATNAATQAGFQLLARSQGRRDQELEELRERLDRVEAHVGLRPAG